MSIKTQGTAAALLAHAFVRRFGQEHRRNLALAEQMGLPILTSCSTCLLMLRRAKEELDGGQKIGRAHV